MDLRCGWVLLMALAACSGVPGCSRDTVAPAPPPIEASQTRNAERPSVPTAIRFQNVTAETGIDFTYRNGQEADNDSILESLGGGLAMIDFDGDGLLDLFLTGGGGFQGQRIFGHPSVLYRNLGGWRFENCSDAAAGGFAAEHYTHGSFVGDYDNDGFPDLLVTGYGGVQLWHNQGDGTFIEVHDAAGLDDSLWSSAAAWGDVNGDGFLDLYVCHYVDWSFDNHPYCPGPQPNLREICSPRVFGPLPDHLYLSNADGTFRNVSEEAGLRLDGKGLGVVMGDIDSDGDLDIYVANDTTENFLYLNDGQGVFEETAILSGVAVDERGTPNGSMGVDLGDYNLDGRPDIWVANFEVESFGLYRNDGNAQFLHVSQATGVTALNGLFVGFGTAFVDIDRDGDEDLVVANGHVINFPRNAPLLQEPLLLINEQGRQFRRLLLQDSYFAEQHAGRGLAIGDLDNDGDADLAFSNNQQPVALLRNDSADPGHWLQVRLIGQEANRDAVGTWLVLETSRGELLRLIKGGTSYLSSGDLRVFWGFPPDTQLRQLRIRWPGGQQQVVVSPPANQSITLVQP